MSDVEKSKGLFQRLFGSKSSRCCTMEFEEEPAPEAEALKDQAQKPATDPAAEATPQNFAVEEGHVSGPT